MSTSARRAVRARRRAAGRRSKRAPPAARRRRLVAAPARRRRRAARHCLRRCRGDRRGTLRRRARRRSRWRRRRSRGEAPSPHRLDGAVRRRRDTGERDVLERRNRWQAGAAERIADVVVPAIAGRSARQHVVAADAGAGGSVDVRAGAGAAAVGSREGLGAGAVWPNPRGTGQTDAVATVFIGAAGPAQRDAAVARIGRRGQVGVAAQRKQYGVKSGREGAAGGGHASCHRLGCVDERSSAVS